MPLFQFRRNKEKQAMEKSEIEDSQEKASGLRNVELALKNYQGWLDSAYRKSLTYCRPIGKDGLISQKERDKRELADLRQKKVDAGPIARREEAMAIQRSFEQFRQEGKGERMIEHFERVRGILSEKVAEAKQAVDNAPQAEIEEYNNLKNEIKELKEKLRLWKVKLEQTQAQAQPQPLAYKVKKKYPSGLVELEQTVDPQIEHRLKDLEGGILNAYKRISLKEQELPHLPYTLKLKKVEDIEAIAKAFNAIQAVR